MHDLINITVQTQKKSLANTLEVGTLFIDYLGRICTITKKGLFYAFLGEPDNDVIGQEEYVTPVVIAEKKSSEFKLELSGLKFDGDEVYLPDTLG